MILYDFVEDIIKIFYFIMVLCMSTLLYFIMFKNKRL